MPNKPAKAASKALVVIPQDTVDEMRLKHTKVTDRQAELVAALMHDGCTITAAAKRIGGNRQWANNTLKKQHVRDYMMELAYSVLGVHASRALASMGSLLDTKSDWLRFEVARDLLDRAGVKQVPEPAQGPVMNIQINLG